MYKDALVKAGAPFSFETVSYTMDGGVIDVAVKEAELPSKPAAPPAPQSR